MIKSDECLQYVEEDKTNSGFGSFSVILFISSTAKSQALSEKDVFVRIFLWFFFSMYRCFHY